MIGCLGRVRTAILRPAKRIKPAIPHPLGGRRTGSVGMGYNLTLGHQIALVRICRRGVARRAGKAPFMPKRCHARCHFTSGDTGSVSRSEMPGPSRSPRVWARAALVATVAANHPQGSRPRRPRTDRPPLVTAAGRARPLRPNALVWACSAPEEGFHQPAEYLHGGVDQFPTRLPHQVAQNGFEAGPSVQRPSCPAGGFLRGTAPFRGGMRPTGCARPRARLPAG